VKDQSKRQTATFEEHSYSQHAHAQRSGRAAHRKGSADQTEILERIKKLQRETKLTA
jgi:hypothetical protein